MNKSNITIKYQQFLQTESKMELSMTPAISELFLYKTHISDIVSSKPGTTQVHSQRYSCYTGGVRNKESCQGLQPDLSRQVKKHLRHCKIATARLDGPEVSVRCILNADSFHASTPGSKTVVCSKPPGFSSEC